MAEMSTQQRSGDRIRVLRVAHASLTPALRERERALAKECADIDLEVLTTARWREAGVDVQATDDDLFPVTPARAYLSNHIQLFAYDPRPVIAALRRHRPHLIDLNHEPYSIACAEVLALCDLLTPRIPVVVQIAQNILRRYPPPINWLQRRALRRINAAYACSEEARAVLRAKGFDKPVGIVPFGVNTDAFAPRRSFRRTDRALTIGFVGRMLPGKGLGVLAEALQWIATEDWKLLVVGDGPERKSFEQALGERRLMDRAEFAGAVAYERIPDFYRRMDMLVMPTRTTKRIREQFGRVLVEAMSSGVPVVGTTCGAIPEVIDDAGIIVPEDDAAAMAEALRQLLGDEPLRERLAQAGRERVEQHYSWEQVARATYTLFRQVLRGKSSTGVTHQIEVAA
jgi:glycosyltransferase involved in cell wall biosynthesis